MNCCDHECNQGRDCPVRKRRIKPYPETPDDLPIQMVEPEEELPFAYAFGIVVAIIAAVGAMTWLIVEVLK